MIDNRLVTFITVAKTKNFTKAAQMLNLTQPAVSQQIKFIEDFYKVKLIERQGRELNLTEEGKLFFDYAVNMKELSWDIKHKLNNLQSSTKKYIVGATMTIGGYVLPYILGEYKNLHKNVDILLKVENTHEILKKLTDNDIELALVEGPFDKKKFIYEKFREDELVLAVSPKHPFSKGPMVSIEHVLKGNLILREKGSGTREIFEHALITRGYDLVENVHPYMEIGDINAIIAMVESNLGYTIISREAITKAVRSGSVVVVPIHNMVIYREFNFVYLPSGPKEFIDDFIHFVISREELNKVK